MELELAVECCELDDLVHLTEKDELEFVKQGKPVAFLRQTVGFEFSCRTLVCGTGGLAYTDRGLFAYCTRNFYATCYCVEHSSYQNILHQYWTLTSLLLMVVSSAQDIRLRNVLCYYMNSMLSPICLSFLGFLWFSIALQLSLLGLIQHFQDVRF